MRLATITVVALCVTGTMAASSSAKSDDVTRGLLCIHQYEGSWSDGGAPYWGGLQMDLSFQRSYGYKMVRVFKHWVKVSFMEIWGTADHWPIRAQLEAGRNAVKSRGWRPWPNTARYCGLL